MKNFTLLLLLVSPLQAQVLPLPAGASPAKAAALAAMVYASTNHTIVNRDWQTVKANAVRAQDMWNVRAITNPILTQPPAPSLPAALDAKMAAALGKMTAANVANVNAFTSLINGDGATMTGNIAAANLAYDDAYAEAMLEVSALVDACQLMDEANMLMNTMLDVLLNLPRPVLP